MKNISDMIAENPGRDLNIIQLKIKSPETVWPPVSVEPSPEAVIEPKPTALKVIADKIRILHRQVESTEATIQNIGRQSLDSAIKIGEMLDKVKKQLEHGQYEKWVKQNCPFDVLTARRYRLISSHGNLLKDCQTIREAQIRLGLRKIEIIEIPLGEAEAVKIRPGEKPKEPEPAEKPKEPRKFYDENEKPISAAQFRNDCIKKLNEWTLVDVSALDLDLSHWSVENGSVLAPGDSSEKLDKLCESIWTKGTLKGDVAEVFSEKEYFQVKSRAVVYGLLECLIKSNQVESVI